MTDTSSRSGTELLLAYAQKHGFGEEYASLVEMHKRDTKDPLELLVQAQGMHRQAEDDVCGLEASIGAIVDENRQSWLHGTYQACARIAKVAMKGTWYAARNLKLHYPLVGALPGHVQERIAKKYDESTLAYVASNSISEFLLVPAAAGYLIESTQEGWGLVGGLGAGTIELCIVAFRTIQAASTDGDGKPKIPNTYGSPLVGIVYWPAYGVIMAGKKAIALPKLLAHKVRDGYHAAWEEEKEHTTTALCKDSAKARVDINEDLEVPHAIKADQPNRACAKARLK